ncbi:MAG: hypothetical protein ABFD15_01790 [Methanofastidiosum sp.]
MSNGLINAGIVLIVLGSVIAILTYGPTMDTRKTFEEFDNNCKVLEKQLQEARDTKIYNEEQLMQNNHQISNLEDSLQECYYYRGEVAENMTFGPSLFFSGSKLIIFIGTFFMAVGGLYWGGSAFYRIYKSNKSKAVSTKTNPSININSPNILNKKSTIIRPNDTKEETYEEVNISEVEEALHETEELMGEFSEEVLTNEVTEEKGNMTFYEDLNEENIKENVYDLLKTDPGISKSKISNVLSIDELDVELAIKDLIDEGRIIDTGKRFIL